jgi:hypothetical protein
VYRLSYVPGNNYSICVFNKNRLFLCGKDAFEKTIARGDRRFPITALPGESENLVDFKKALEI